MIGYSQKFNNNVRKGKGLMANVSDWCNPEQRYHCSGLESILLCGSFSSPFPGRNDIGKGVWVAGKVQAKNVNGPDNHGYNLIIEAVPCHIYC